MVDDVVRSPGEEALSGDSSGNELPQPHLLNLVDPATVADWIFQVGIAAGIGLAATETVKAGVGKIRDVLRRWKNEKGRSEVTTLKRTVIVIFEEHQTKASEPEPVDLKKVTAQIDEIFSEFE